MKRGQGGPGGASAASAGAAAPGAERESARAARQSALEDTLCYVCAICAREVLNVEAGEELERAPVRRSDGAAAVHEARALRRLLVCAGPERIIVRPGAPGRPEGAERQFPLHCTGCNVMVGYRTAPLRSPSKYTYVFAGALVPAPERGAAGAGGGEAPRPAPGGADAAPGSGGGA